MSAPVTAALERAAELLGELARRDEPIGARTTYRVGGRAALFVQVNEESTLERVARAVAASGVEVLLLGRGSNLLVADAGFPGLCLTLGGDLAGCAIEPASRRVEAGAGLELPVLARRTAAAGCGGLEWAVGIPGSVGGAVQMNAGGHGSETSERLLSARVVDLATGEDSMLSRSQLGLGYRRSALRAEQLVCGATFACEAGEPERSLQAIAEIVAWRRANQPGGRNAGSIFANPPGDSAGRLVDAAGLKGLRLGSAEVSPRHANFIQADAGGSADDVHRLVGEVRRLVAERLGVELVPELRFAGSFR